MNGAATSPPLLPPAPTCPAIAAAPAGELASGWMSDAGRAPERRERLIVDRDALPDPSVWIGSGGRGNRAAVVRIVLAAAGLVAGVAFVAFGMGSTNARLAAVRAALPAAGALAGSGVPPARTALDPDAPPQATPITPEALAELQRSWKGSETIAPRDARVDAATGERAKPFHGYGVSVETSPAGARVLVNGEDKGTTPLVATVDCVVGDPVEVVAEHGRRRGRVETRCRRDALVELAVPLRPR